VILRGSAIPSALANQLISSVSRHEEEPPAVAAPDAGRAPGQMAELGRTRCDVDKDCHLRELYRWRARQETVNHLYPFGSRCPDASSACSAGACQRRATHKIPG
jgi:hypothetical protein